VRAQVLAALSSLAETQLGCFTREQARRQNVSDYQLRALARDNVVEKAAPRVYRFTATPATWLQKVMVASLDGGPDCHASHRTAAALHRYPGFRLDGIIEVLVPMHVRHRRKDVIVHHTRSFPEIDRTKVGAIPVTSPARTLIDLGAVLPAHLVEEAFDGAERDKRVSRYRVESRYKDLRAPGRNGIGAMTQILDQREAVRRVPRSVLERRFKRICERAGLPMFVTAFVLNIGGEIFELDFASTGLRLGIETDGHGSHATRSERAADADRQNKLEDEGWTIRRLTYEQIMFDEPHVVQTVKRAIKACEVRAALMAKDEA
jgi:hypothetical protein